MPRQPPRVIDGIAVEVKETLEHRIRLVTHDDGIVAPIELGGGVGTSSHTRGGARVALTRTGVAVANLVLEVRRAFGFIERLAN